MSTTNNKTRRKAHMAKINPEPVFDDIGGDQIDDTEAMINVINKPKIDATAFNAFAYGLACIFQSKGGVELSPNTSTFGHGVIFIAEALRATALGATVNITEAPYIMSFVAALLTRKNIPNFNGSSTYSADIDTAVDTGSTYVGGPSNGSVIYNLGQIDDSSVVDGRIPLSKSMDAYTAELGREAYQFILDELTGTDHDMLKMSVYPLDDDSIKKNPSAFAFAVQSVGGGLFSTAAWETLLASETQLRTPLFGKFVTNRGEAANLGRAANFAIKNTGDLVFSAVIAAGVLDVHQLHTKRPMVIKPIDFNRLGDMIARAFTAALQLYVNGVDFADLFEKRGLAAYTDAMHPLTLQRWLLTLRNVVMTYAGVYQTATQSTFSVQEMGGGVTFRPFAAGTGQSAIPGTRSVLLPQPVTENLAGLMGFKAAHTKATVRHPYVIAPQWGIWGEQSLNTKDYTVTWTDGETTYTELVFTVNPVEPAIDLADGSTGTKIAWINSSGYLNDDATKHNTWITDLGDYFQPLSNLNADGGIKLLSTLTSTSHAFVDNNRVVETKKSEMIMYVPGSENMTTTEVEAVRDYYRDQAKTKNAKAVPTSIYDDYYELATSHFHAALLPVTTSPNVDWLRPTNVVRNPLNSGDNSIVQTFQQLTGEMVTEIDSQGTVDLKSYSSIHQQFAESCVREPFAPVPVAGTIFADALAQGDGGILGDMIGNVAGAALKTVAIISGEVAAGLAEKAGGAIPI